MCDFAVCLLNAFNIGVFIELEVSHGAMQVDLLKSVLSVDPVHDLGLHRHGDLLGLLRIFGVGCLLLDLKVRLCVHLQLLAVDALVISGRLVKRNVRLELLTCFLFDLLSEFVVFRTGRKALERVDVVLLGDVEEAKRRVRD